MSNKKYFWLKLKDNFFETEEVVLIESMPNGEKYINFYLKLLLKSVRTEGRLMFRETIPYTPEMLSTITRTDIDTVKVAVDTFVNLGLMEKLDDGALFMSETTNMIGSESSSAKRVREMRKRKALHCNSSVTKSNTEIEKDLDLKLELDKYKDIYNNMAKANGLSTILKLSDTRKKNLKARLKEYSDEEIVKAIELVSNSDFLTGRKTDWKCNFDWIFNKSNFLKLIEGNYNNKDDNKSKVNFTSSKEDEAKEEDYYIDEYGDKWIGDVRVFDNN